MHRLARSAVVAAFATASLAACGGSGGAAGPTSSGPTFKEPALPSALPPGDEPPAGPVTPPPASTEAPEFCSVDGFCWLDPRPSGSSLSGVWVAADGTAWAAGSRGAMLRWDGERWGSVRTGYSGRIRAVWGGSADDVWAVGDAILHFDGTAWSTVRAAPAGQTYLAVHGSGPDDVWAVGSGGAAARFDGSSWREASFPFTSAELAAVDVYVAGGGEAFAVGSGYGSVARFADGRWQEALGLVAGELSGVWGSSADDVWVVGSAQYEGRTRRGHHVFRWDGSAWSGIDVPGAEDVAWADVGGSPAAGVWLVGGSFEDGGANRARWDGAAWTTGHVAAPATSAHVRGGEGFAVGHGGAIARLASGAWTIQHPGNQHWLNDVVAAREGTAWIAAHHMTSGATTTLLRYSGGALSEVPLGVSELVYGLAPVGANDLWAATYGSGLAHYDGTRWTMDVGGIARDAALPVAGVWASAPSDVWALLGSELAHWDGARLTRHPVDAEYLERAWGSAPDDVWAVGDVGSAHHWDGSAWTKVPLPVQGLTLDVWGRSRGDVWIVGYDGLALHFDGSSWSRVETGTTASLNRVVGDATGRVWAVGEDGAVLEWTGAAFRSLDSGTHGWLTGAAWDPTLGLVVVGNEGVLQRLP